MSKRNKGKRKRNKGNKELMFVNIDRLRDLAEGRITYDKEKYPKMKEFAALLLEHALENSQLVTLNDDGTEN